MALCINQLDFLINSIINNGNTTSGELSMLLSMALCLRKAGG